MSVEEKWSGIQYEAIAACNVCAGRTHKIISIPNTFTHKESKNEIQFPQLFLLDTLNKM